MANIANEHDAWRCVRACQDYMRKVDRSPRAADDLGDAIQFLIKNAEKKLAQNVAKDLLEIINTP